MESQHYGLMIACDGYAMKKGLLELWSMIVKENVTVITSFNESFDRNGSWFEVYKYFPEDSESKFDIENTYSLKTVNKKKTTGTITRMISVCDYKTGAELHKVKHIHFKVWDDFDVPSNENTGELMTCLQEQVTMLLEQISLMREGKTTKPKKILMHCLAGRGRTGTAIAIINAMMTIRGQKLKFNKNLVMQTQLSVFSIVRRLRE